MSGNVVEKGFFPDISLPPKIAFYFDVTKDEKSSRRSQFVNISDKVKFGCQNGENQKIWKSGKRHILNFRRIAALSVGSACNHQRWGVSLPKLKQMRNIIVSEELCRDHGHFLSKREKCYTMFVLYLADIIDKRKALYYADMSGTFHITREDLRTTILDGEEGVKACQSYMMSFNSYGCDDGIKV